MLRPGLKCGGLESKFGRGSRPLDRSGVGWSFVPGYKRGVCFGVPARIHWFTNHHFCETVRLGYGLAP